MAYIPEHIQLYSEIYNRSEDYEGKPTWEYLPDEATGNFQTKFVIYIDNKWQVVATDSGERDFTTYNPISVFDSDLYAVFDSFDKEAYRTCFCNVISSLSITTDIGIFNGLYTRVNDSSRTVFGNNYSKFRYVDSEGNEFYVQMDMTKKRNSSGRMIREVKWALYGFPLPYEGYENFTKTFELELGRDFLQDQSICCPPSADYFPSFSKLGAPAVMFYNYNSGFQRP